MVRTVIGYGSPHKAGTAEAHGSPLGADEVEATKQALGWPLEPTFLVPEEARAPFEEARERGRRLQAEWERAAGTLRRGAPGGGRGARARLAGELPDGWEEALPTFEPDDKPMATRAASGKVINAMAPALPELVGGSADLAPSNNTMIKGSADFSATDRDGRNLRFGVREHAMGSILNGIALSAPSCPTAARS